MNRKEILEKVNERESLRGAYLRGAYLQGANLRGAYLRGAHLQGADLQGANLQGANLRGAYLRGAYLQGADLQGANLQGADLRGANLQGADLRGADLQGANLQGADLRGADLQGANLRGANLQGADLQGAYLPNFSLVPEEGSFIAWKKLRNGIICKLQITGKRTSSLVGRKCRCSEAKVLWVSKGISGCSMHDCLFVYRAGETVKEPNYSDDIRLECAPGIHFFLTRKEAEEY